MSLPPAAQISSAATPPDTISLPGGGNEVPLKQAAILVGKNERTLRRKLDDGTLKGRKKPLETGGELWLVDHQSLFEVFTDAATPAAQISSAATPYDLDLFSVDIERIDSLPPTITPPPVARSPLQTAATPAATNVRPSGGAVGHSDKPATSEITEKPRSNSDLTEFLLKEHDSLKDGHQQEISSVRVHYREEVTRLQESLETRDSRISLLQEQNGHLRQELGEVRGRADTEAKMREWLQNQLEQVRLKLEGPQAPYAEPTSRKHADENVIDIESVSTPKATPSTRKLPTGALVGFVFFMLVSFLAVAYSVGLLGTR